jgi:hypothetical protein
MASPYGLRRKYKRWNVSDGEESEDVSKMMLAKLSTTINLCLEK